MLLKNKVAVITGCNKGIGKKTLEVFSQNGANVFACVRKADTQFTEFCAKLEKENKCKIFPIFFDLKDEDQVKEASLQINKKAKKIDILINNAGTIQTSLFQMTTQKDLKDKFQQNVFSNILFTRYILKSMTKDKSGGSIVFLSSTSALDGNVGRNVYSSSKAAIISQMQVLSREIGNLNVRVNAVAPGLTNTEMLKKNTPEKVIKDFENPKEITKQIFKSIDKGLVINNRKLAIKKGIQKTNHNELLLVAGKGQENYQIIKGKKFYFSDYKEIIRNL